MVPLPGHQELESAYEYEYDTAHLAGPDGFDSGGCTKGRLFRDAETHPDGFGMRTGRTVQHGREIAEPRRGLGCRSPFKLFGDSIRVSGGTEGALGRHGRYRDAGGKRRIKAKASDGLTNFQEDASYYFYDGESLSCQLDIGKLVQEEEETYQPKFLMLDHLGSTRAEITFAGTGLVPTVSGSYDYMPYGEFINVPAETAEQVCFTGKPRDGESGLTNLGARLLSGSLLHLTSADSVVFQARMLDDPQSLNLYVYVRNNPLLFVDTTGEAIELTGNEEQRKKQLEALQQTVGSKAGAYLYENKGKDGNYYFRIYTNGPTGEGVAFEILNPVSKDFGLDLEALIRVRLNLRTRCES